MDDDIEPKQYVITVLTDHPWYLQRLRVIKVNVDQITVTRTDLPGKTCVFKKSDITPVPTDNWSDIARRMGQRIHKNRLSTRAT